MEYNKDLYIKFMIVMNKMSASIENALNQQWKDLNINETEFLVLFALDANGPLTIQEIGLKINMTSGTMTYVIDKLEDKKYIKRNRSSTDRRRIFIEMTHEGSIFWHKTMNSHQLHLKKIFGNVSADEMLHLIDLMKQVGKSI